MRSTPGFQIREAVAARDAAARGAIADETGAASDEDESLLQEYRGVREATLALCRNLEVEDTVAQSMPDASPVKWHLAHTSWFFEQFVLSHGRNGRQQRGRRHPKWVEIFNSYYQSIGPQFTRSQRGVLTRPTLSEVIEYRALIDADMQQLLRGASCNLPPAELRDTVLLGLHHERQHQELILTDLLHLFSMNPMEPAYRSDAVLPADSAPVALRYIEGRSGRVEIGDASAGFAYDNERPRHSVLLTPHAIANRPVNNQEYRDFILAGGYQDARLWLAEAWPVVEHSAWQRPLYWADDLQSSFTLHGRQPLDPLAPVSQISFFEASAFCQWAQARLPTEMEWETMAASQWPFAQQGNFAESGLLMPQAPTPPASTLQPLQLFGDVWEWTASPYIPYPGFRPLPGSVGEYNGKFMSGQWVLRGGSCVTPMAQMRLSFRNYFPPAARWQFSGLRLARDL